MSLGVQVSQFVLEFIVTGSNPASPPAIACNAPPNGVKGVLYSHAFPASGGTPPYTLYQITAGSLPPGLVLNPLTGVVSGTPTADGVYAFTIQVTDSASLTGSANFSITIAGPNAGGVGLRINLRGVKRRRVEDCQPVAEPDCGCPEPLPVKRAV